MRADATSRLSVVSLEAEHAPALAEFFRLVWDANATAEMILAARRAQAADNVVEPGTAPPTWVALQSGRVLGYVTTIPVHLWDRSACRPAHWIKGLMVLPELRGGPIGYLLLKAATQSLPLAGGLAVAPPARRLFSALGYRDLGPIPNWVRPLRLGGILSRIDPARLGPTIPPWAQRALALTRASGLARVGGWVGGVVLRGAATVARIPTTGLRMARGTPPPPEELNELWSRCRPSIRAGVVRDAGYLLPRYTPVPGRYRWLEARRRGELLGIAVLRRPGAGDDERLRGIRVSVLSDMLFDTADPAAGLALLGAAEADAREQGADALLATTSSPALMSLLRRQAYLPLAGNVHCLVRDSADDAGPSPDLSAWWLMRGDGQADDGF